jgi:molecular chaperone GrpE
MTRKKDSDTEPSMPEKDNDELTTKKTLEHTVKESDDSKKSEVSNEVKQIAGKEPGKLEYYSKEYLLEEAKKLETDLKAYMEDLKKAKEDAESWKNKYTRLQAEFENAQKRWDKNRKNLRLEYTASVLKSFLPLYDSFKKALSDDKENMKILKGFYDQFMNILKGNKAEPMEVKENEPFDYSTQEALTSVEKTDIPKNTILEVIQDGWKLDNEVLRYAKVIISKEPKPPEPEPEPETVDQEQTIESENTDSENSQKDTEVGKQSTKTEKEETKPEM